MTRFLVRMTETVTSVAYVDADDADTAYEQVPDIPGEAWTTKAATVEDIEVEEA